MPRAPPSFRRQPSVRGGDDDLPRQAHREVPGSVAGRRTSRVGARPRRGGGGAPPLRVPAPGRRCHGGAPRPHRGLLPTVAFRGRGAACVAAEGVRGGDPGAVAPPRAAVPARPLRSGRVQGRIPLRRALPPRLRVRAREGGRPPAETRIDARGAPLRADRHPRDPADHRREPRGEVPGPRKVLP